MDDTISVCLTNKEIFLILGSSCDSDHFLLAWSGENPLKPFDENILRKLNKRKTH